MAKFGLPDASCQAYQGQDRACDEKAFCMACVWRNSEIGATWPGKCQSAEEAWRYHLGDYGAVRGLKQVQAEVLLRGPVACGLEATAAFRNYSGGLHREFRYLPVLDHAVTLVGWYGGAWLGRSSSWGPLWGEEGWFHLSQEKGYNLGVDLDCSWGVPSAEPEALRLL